MKLARLVVVVLAAAVFALAQEPFRLSTDVRRVAVDVYVDASGQPVTNLTREDFSILEDGQPRQISDFAAADTAYNILLLYDNSSSTQAQRRFLLRATSRLVDQLPERDRVALAIFADIPELLIKWTSPRTFNKSPQIPDAVGGTNLYGAIEWALGRFRGLKGRKGILVLTDGIDSRLSNSLVRFDKNKAPTILAPEADGDFKNMIRAVTRASTPLYFVAINTDLNPDPKADTSVFAAMQRTAARQRMELTAGLSGGRVYFPQSIDDVLDYYQEIGRSLGHSYTLLFEPAKAQHDGTRHKIQIRVRDKTMRVTQLRDSWEDR
jgi:VWFA-related protein